MQRLFPAIVILALSLGTPSIASAQSYAVTVWDQLQGAYDVLTDSDDLTVKNYVMGKLTPSASDRWSFPMEEGTEYVLMGACDGDCTDVDLEVTYEGYTVASDTETDDVPVLRFVAQTSGVHVIEIKMYECSAEFCFWGLGLYEN